MNAPELQLSLIPAPDDPRPKTSAYQAELQQFENDLQSKGVKVSASIEVREAWTPVPMPAPYLGDFFIKLLNSPITGVVVGAVATWLHARAGRKVRLKIGDIEAEAQTVKEVEKLLARAQEMQRSNQPKVIHER